MEKLYRMRKLLPEDHFHELSFALTKEIYFNIQSYLQ